MSKERGFSLFFCWKEEPEDQKANLEVGCFARGFGSLRFRRFRCFRFAGEALKP